MDNEKRIQEQSEFVMALHRASHQKEYEQKQKIRLAKLGKKMPRKHKQPQGEQK